MHEINVQRAVKYARRKLGISVLARSCYWLFFTPAFRFFWYALT
jgi:hypothetical protein